MKLLRLIRSLSPIGVQAHMGKRGLQLFQERFDFASLVRNLLPVLEAARL